jgi:peptide/nickel transport system substrate-binding protein
MFAKLPARIVAGVGLLAVCASGLAGCEGAGDTDGRAKDPVVATHQEPKFGGRIVYGLETDPNGLDPTRNVWDHAGLQLANALYDPLVAFDVHGQPKPYLAESYSHSPDFKTWDINLRAKAVFHDGEKVDAAAVTSFLNAMRTSSVNGALSMIEDVRRLGDLTVRITTTEPWATLPVSLTGQAGYVVSPKQIADPQGQSRPNGTGPFMLSSWKVNEQFELVRNPRYWREGLPRVEAVEFVVEPDDQTRMSRLRRGTMDLATIVDRAVVEDAERMAGTESASQGLAVSRDGGHTDLSGVVFNTMKPPLDDVRIRRAIAHATDLRAVAKKVGWPAEELAQGPIDPGSPLFAPAPYPTFDAARARTLVKEHLADRRPASGGRAPERRGADTTPERQGSDGAAATVSFTILGLEADAVLLNELAHQWSKVGIDATVSLIDQKRQVRLTYSGEFQAVVTRLPATPDPDLFWQFFVENTIKPSGASVNMARLRSPEITSAMNEARATVDVEARKQAYARAQQAFADRMPYLWLERSAPRLVTTGRVRDAGNVSLPDGSKAQPMLGGAHRLTETWLDDAEHRSPPRDGAAGNPGV